MENIDNSKLQIELNFTKDIDYIGKIIVINNNESYQKIFINKVQKDNVDSSFDTYNFSITGSFTINR